MPYNLIIKKEAAKILKGLTHSVRNRITEKIVILGKNPDDMLLDVKALSGVQKYRLRIGKWRVIFQRDDVIKIIAIEKIKSRGDVYK